MVKFSNTTITSFNEIFQRNAGNEKEKTHLDAATRGWFAAENCDKN